MNIDALRLAQGAVAAETVVSVGNVSSVFLAADPNRIGIFLPATNGLRYTVSMAGAAVLDQGITVLAAGPGVLLTLDTIGPWVQQALKVIGSVAGPTNVSVVTWTLTARG